MKCYLTKNKDKSCDRCDGNRMSWCAISYLMELEKKIPRIKNNLNKE